MLLSEGIAKEIVNRIQNIRKSSDFNVTDRINVSLSGGEMIKKAVDDFGQYIANEVLAEDMSLSETLVDGESYELTDGVDVLISVDRI